MGSRVSNRMAYIHNGVSLIDISICTAVRSSYPSYHVTTRSQNRARIKYKFEFPSFTKRKRSQIPIWA
jgi:hypothetical protein